MGLGHFRSENLEWNSQGFNKKLVGDYKIPSALDLPEKWQTTMTGEAAKWSKLSLQRWLKNTKNDIENYFSDMTDLDKDATIRARWPGEAGQHLALATV